MLKVKEYGAKKLIKEFL